MKQSHDNNKTVGAEGYGERNDRGTRLVQFAETEVPIPGTNEQTIKNGLGKAQMKQSRTRLTSY